MADLAGDFGGRIDFSPCSQGGGGLSGPGHSVTRERISAVGAGCGGQVGAQGPQFYAEKTAKRSRLHGYRPAAKRSSRTLASPSNGKRESAMWGDMALSG